MCQRLRMKACTVFASALALMGAVSGKLLWPELEMPHVTNAGRKLMNIEFDELSVPMDLERHLVRLSSSAYVDGVKVETKYNVLQRSGDIHGGQFGRVVNKDGEPLFDADGKPYISNNADFSSLMSFGKGIVYSISHFEGPNPSSAYLTKLTQDKATGVLTVVSTGHLDFSPYNGLWNPCAGSVSPWKTHIGSEEYEPDARVFEESSIVDIVGDGTEDNTGNEDIQGILHYMRVKNIPENPSAVTLEEVQANFFPYLYGHIWEARVDPETGTAKPIKHFTQGRLAYELAKVMPDGKTVYRADDGDNKVFTKFVCSKAGDLSEGTLYAAKFTQKPSDIPGGMFDLEWVSLGYAKNSDVEPYAKTTKFSDLFETAAINTDNATMPCPVGFRSIKAGDEYDGSECLKLVTGMEVLASRFETRRYAAYMRATAEFSKWEGITLDKTRMRLYIAMSEIRRGMEDNMGKGEATTEYDFGGPNDIRLPYNPCGCVYYMDMDKSWSAYNMHAMLCGVENPDYVALEEGAPVSKEQDLDPNYHNFCTLDSLANPDNVAYVRGHDGLVIGEDTVGGHQNDVMWYYDFRTGNKTRFFSTPYGSETTSPYWYPNINGHSYIMAVVQHPYAESDEDKIDEPQSTGMSNWVGYVGPFHPPQCAKRWGQCDGMAGSFHGPYCCENADICTKVNEWFSGCHPGPTPADKVAVWGQCGGKEHKGLTSCEMASMCVMQNEWYSQCLPY